MKRTMTTIYLSTLVLILFTSIAYAQWTHLDFFNDYYLTSVFFTSTETGYTVGYDTTSWVGAIWSTDDGGDSWNTFLTPDTLMAPLSVYFVDANTGFVGSIGAIWKTDNGGTNWTPIYVGSPTSAFHSIHFPSPNTGYAVGYDYTNNLPRIYKTIDGGNNWDPQTSPVNHELRSVYCTDNNTCYIVGWDSTILKTTDGGADWNPLSSPVNRDLASVYFTDSQTGYVVGGVNDYETILKTTNAGPEWVVQRDTSSVDGFLLSVYFVDSNTGYAVGSGGWILSTINGGVEWGVQSSGTTNELTAVFFPDDTTGYVVGESGTILKTTNGGGVGIGSRDVKRIPVQFSLAQNYPNPFNPSTTISFQIPGAASAKQPVKLIVYDIRGRRVKTLIDSDLEPGSHKIHWDGRNDQRESVASGIYLYALNVRGERFTRKMTVLK